MEKVIVLEERQSVVKMISEQSKAPSLSGSHMTQMALTTLLARASLHTGLMLTDGHELHAEALPFLHKAAALSPALDTVAEGLSRALIRRARTLELEGRWVEAENRLRKALALTVDTEAASKALADVLVNRAQIFHKEQMRPFKIAALAQEALALAPENEEAKALLGTPCPLQNALEGLDLLEAQEAALRREEGDSISLSNILSQQGVLAFNEAQIHEAEAAFRKAVVLQDDPLIVEGLVRCLCANAIEFYDKVRFSDAEAALWEALTMRPEDEQATQILTHITSAVPRYVHNIMNPEFLNDALTLRKLLCVKDAVGRASVRIGSIADGGYVMIDHNLSNGIVYSLGIGDNVSWDLDMANRGCQIYQYDHTIERLPVEHPNFHWSKKGIAGTSSADTTFCTLDQLIDANGHRGRNDLILKIDIESFEWSVFAEMPEETLRQFSQIVGEFHRFARLIDPQYRDTMRTALTKINKHFQLVHAHANNFTGMALISGVPVYYCMELTFVRRTDHTFTRTEKLFPTPLDSPCIPKIADLFLGEFAG